jgi:photosystem II stability/assembly factor-like uncharacterized protein
VYVSSNEGKSWNRAEDIPKGNALMVIEHPFDNRYVSAFISAAPVVPILNASQAFVLTDGTRHYRTEDRGKTWRHFDVPLPPAMVANPLSFHSDPAKYGYVLYQGMRCTGKGWGSICHDEVTSSLSHTHRHSPNASDLLHEGSIRRRPQTPAFRNIAMPIRARQQGL